MSDDGMHFDDLETWRAWLEVNHGTTEPVWIRFYKKPTGRRTIRYDDAIEEALSWGWIDSLIKRVDDDLYLRKFTPRKAGSNWSALNRKRVRKLIAEGRMQPPGLALIEGVDLDEAPPNPATAAPIEPPSELAGLLATNETASREFEKLPPSQKRRYIGWIMAAKRNETRARRAAEAVEMLERGERLSGK
jgi:uncharacterized protein YdeI (YjbR/CyaY-like superfamily)